MVTERLYWFYVVDPTGGKDQEGSELLRNFIGKNAFKLDNLFIFSSSAKIEEMHSFIKKNMLRDFMYFLIDMTDNITSDTFKSILNETGYRPAPKLTAFLKNYKPVPVVLTNSKLEEQKINEILDKVVDSKKGVKALTKDDKKYIQSLTPAPKKNHEIK